MPREALRRSHISITLNDRSSKMELRIDTAIKAVMERIQATYGIASEWQKEVKLNEIVSHLNTTFGEQNGITFEKATSKPSPSLKPDGGFIFVRDSTGQKRCILGRVRKPC